MSVGVEENFPMLPFGMSRSMVVGRICSLRRFENLRGNIKEVVDLLRSRIRRY